MLPRMPQQLKKRLQAWQIQRTPKGSKVTLNQRSIYILPTREGALYILAFISLFTGGINYVNSLILALTFFLIGLMLVVIIDTFRNLNGLTFSAEISEPGFESDFIRYRILISGSKNQHHEKVAVKLAESAEVYCSIAGDQPQQVDLFVPAHRRGIQKPGRLKISTRFPIGIMKSWSWIDLQLESLVYPRPIQSEEPWTQNAGIHDFELQRTIGNDDFAGLRPFHDGDQLSRVYWKVVARGLPLATKEFEQPLQQHKLLTLDAVEGSLEQRLSYLCYWVLKYSESNIPFSLQLTQTSIALHSGEDHKRQCLKALALYPSHHDSVVDPLESP